MPARLSASYREAVLWQEQVTRDPLPVRDVPASADVVVVGGGYCGLSAARSAAEAGASVVLLEKEELGTGASTRNGGMVIPELKASPAKLAKKYGPQLYAEVDEAFKKKEAEVMEI